ncbi:MAG: phage portal protein [Flavobacteriales bacterium]|nr:phage portal protein [Flavobacteriales bacterium]
MSKELGWFILMICSFLRMHIWKSPIRLFAENLGVDMAATQYGARFFGEAANPAALVSPKETVGKQYNTLVDTFKEQYGGINKSHGTVVAPIPVNYQRITIPANDSQFIETRKMTKGDICTIFNVPPFKVQAESDVKYSNAETQTTQFKVDCIQPICELIEAELTKKIIPAPNRRTISLAFNLKNLTRGDIKARAEYTQKLIASGVLKINEAREEEGYNPTEGGDRNLVQVNLLPLDRIDDYADKIIDSGQIQQSKGNG